MSTQNNQSATESTDQGTSTTSEGPKASRPCVLASTPSSNGINRRGRFREACVRAGVRLWTASGKRNHKWGSLTAECGGSPTPPRKTGGASSSPAAATARPLLACQPRSCPPSPAVDANIHTQAHAQHVMGPPPRRRWGGPPCRFQPAPPRGFGALAISRAVAALQRRSAHHRRATLAALAARRPTHSSDSRAPAPEAAGGGPQTSPEIPAGPRRGSAAPMKPPDPPAPGRRQIINN